MDQTFTPPKTRVLPGETYPQHYVAMHEHMTAYRDEHGYPPSTLEMVEAGFASSTSVVLYYYERMESLGMLTYIRKSPRAITLHPKKDWKKHARKGAAAPVYKFTRRPKPEKKEEIHAREI